MLLQRGQNAYSQVTDTYLSVYHDYYAFGSRIYMQDYLSDYSTLARFAIFQSEGGPVPNGATIESASLSLYKFTGYDMVYQLNPLLRDWQEGAATWTRSAAGSLWSVAGASGAGSDYAATADAMAQTGFNPGWVVFNVAAGVQRMSNSSPVANFGWKLRGVGGDVSGLKRFYTSEADGDIALRPKLQITYR